MYFDFRKKTKRNFTRKVVARVYTTLLMSSETVEIRKITERSLTSRQDANRGRNFARIPKVFWRDVVKFRNFSQEVFIFGFPFENEGTLSKSTPFDNLKEA